MQKQQSAATARLYSPRATLCAIGIKLHSLKLFDTIAEHVQIKQKTVGFAHKVGSVPGIQWFADSSTQHTVYATDFMGKAR